MGSTLETSIVFSLVVIILCLIITGPEDICVSAFNVCKSGFGEISLFVDDDRLISNEDIDGVTVTGCSPERFCTYASGLSDCYRLIYGSVYDMFGGDDDEIHQEEE